MERADLARACRRLLERFKSLPPGRIRAPLLSPDDHGWPAVKVTSRELVIAFHSTACAAGEVTTEIREVLGLPPDDSSNGLDGRWLALVVEAARAEVAPPPCRISRAPYPPLLTMAQAAEVARTMEIVARPQVDAEPVEMVADAVEASIALVELVVERVEIGMVEARSVMVAARPPRAKGRKRGRMSKAEQAACLSVEEQLILADDKDPTVKLSTYRGLRGAVREAIGDRPGFRDYDHKTYGESLLAKGWSKTLEDLRKGLDTGDAAETFAALRDMLAAGEDTQGMNISPHKPGRGLENRSNRTHSQEQRLRAAVASLSNARVAAERRQQQTATVAARDPARPATSTSNAARAAAHYDEADRRDRDRSAAWANSRKPQAK